MALLTLAEYKAMIGESSSVYDAQFQALIDAAAARIESYCSRRFESSEYSEFYTGRNSQYLCLRQWPVTAVANVWERSDGVFGQDADSPFDATALLVNGRDYVLSRENSSYGKSGVLLRIGKPWPSLMGLRDFGRMTPVIGPSFGNIKVQYTAGFVEIPKDLKQAVVLLAQYWRMASRFGAPVQQEQLGKWSYQLQGVVSAGVLPMDVQSILSSYVEVVL